MATTYNASAAGGPLSSGVSVIVPADADPLNVASVNPGLQKSADYLEALRTGRTSIQVIDWVALTTQADTTQRWMPRGGGGTAPVTPALNASIVMPRAGTASVLSAQGPGNSTGAGQTLTLYKNGVASGVTVTVTAGSSVLFQDLVHTLAFVAGDLIALGIVGGVGITGGQNPLLASAQFLFS